MRTLSSLAPGQRFHQPGTGLDGTLVAVGAASTVVDLERPTERAFRTAEGQDVSFRQRVERTTWSLGTEVMPR